MRSCPCYSELSDLQLKLYKCLSRGSSLPDSGASEHSICSQDLLEAVEGWLHAHVSCAEQQQLARQEIAKLDLGCRHKDSSGRIFQGSKKLPTPETSCNIQHTHAATFAWFMHHNYPEILNSQTTTGQGESKPTMIIVHCVWRQNMVHDMRKTWHVRHVRHPHGYSSSAGLGANPGESRRSRAKPEFFSFPTSIFTTNHNGENTWSWTFAYHLYSICYVLPGLLRDLITRRNEHADICWHKF